MGLSNRVRSVVVLAADGTARTLFERRKRKKKTQTPILRPLETLTRRLVEGLGRGAEVYVEEHQDANRKARDGWIQELGQNVFKASRKGISKVARGLYD